ncbi:MAG TPA: Ig-like domain-containing protein [Candidatus Tectomicrobia bacterium]
MRGRGIQPLRHLGLLLGLLCILAGCGSNGGSSTTGNTASRSRQLALQLQLSSETASTAPPAGLAAAQARQVQPGDPAFIERLEIRLQVQDSDFVPPQVFLLDPAQQETATLDVAVPDTVPATFEVLVSAFTSQGIEAYRGQTTVARSQTSAVVSLPRFAFVPVPATAANLQQTTFNFTDGTVFGLANMPVTLATGTFAGDVGDFALTGSGSVASGSVTIGSCTFVVTTSSFLPGQGLQVGDQIVIDPCQVDAIDRRLIITNVSVSLTPTISSTPVVIPPDTILNLPPPLTLTIAEDTSGTVQVVASVSGTRPGTITLGITIPPARGTASLTNAGAVTYQPAGNFNGSDSLVVTVVATFSDNSSPALLLGTVPISIIVQPVGDVPMPTGPSINTSLNTPGTVQISVNDPDGGQTQTFSISIPPANGIATVTASGLVTYTPAPGFSGADSFVVTVTDNGTPPLSGTVTIPVTVQVPPPPPPPPPLNQAPAPTAPGISTLQNTPGTSTVSPNDPDAGQIQIFSISTPPANGTATVTVSGLATYTPAPGFSGADSFVVTVTDNGTPPLSGTVTIPVTVQAPPNRAPGPTAPGISTPQNMPGTSLVSPNDPDAGQTQAFSISTPPANGTTTVTASGVATYTPAPGFSGTDSFAVTVTDNGTPPLSGTVTIPVTVQAPPNRAPVPTAPAISTPQNTPGTSPVSPNDPDAGQLHTFSISTPPANGTVTVSASGLATYTPASGFSGADSFIVTVTDNGAPPLSGTVTIPVTVLPNRPPEPDTPGAQSNVEGDVIGLQINASDPDGNGLTFSASGLPFGLAINAVTGFVSGTIASGAAASIPFNTTVTVTDNGLPPLSTSVSFPWSVTPNVLLNTVRIISPAGPVSPGATFPATVQVNTGTTNVVSYLFELTFNSDVVVIDSPPAPGIAQGSPLFEVPITNLGTPEANRGTVRFAANNPTFTPANGVLTLATITFRVVGSPGMNSALTLRLPSNGLLVDSDFQAIDVTFPAVNGPVTVN